jgi:3-hydroxyisobutyrate dehydrogenase-like beta-hydroxyacid dehydrogenase
MARKSRKNVGLIGLGIIGSRIAAGLRAGGFHVFVWNRTPKPAPNFVGSPAEVAEICDVIQIFVADAAAVHEIIDAFGEQLGPRHVIVNCATIGPEATVEIAQRVQERGAAYLDCPFTGSKGAAEKSQLTYYVGGDEAVFMRVKPVLEATSRAILRCGRVGDASTLKVATNLITAVTTQTLAEALAIVKAAGIPGEALSAALEHNACKSGVTDLKLPKMMSGDYEPHFSVKHMFKDVQLGIHLANASKLEVPLTTVVGGVLYGALCNGWGDLDFASLYRVYTEAPTPEPEPKALTEKPKEAAPPADDELDEFEDREIEPLSAAPAAEEKPLVDTAAAMEAVPEGLSAPASADAEIEADIFRRKGPSMEAGRIDLVKAGEPKTIEVEVEEVKVEETPKTAEPVAATVAEPTVPSEERTMPAASAPTEPVAASSQPETPAIPAANGIEAVPEEDAGLAGFFSRVFRRRGTPVGK